MTNAILLPEEKCKHGVLEIEKFANIFNTNTKQQSTENFKEQHIHLVQHGIETIRAGGLNKVVLSRSEENPISNTDPISIFKRLFNTYKNAMVYCWYHPKVGLWLGATPELLFKVEGQQLTTISLAGTRVYSDNDAPKWTHKEIDEQQIVTDFITEQIEPYVSQTDVSEVETIRAGDLWHLKTRIISRIKPDSNLNEIVSALHPTPAVCGFPRGKAMSFILSNENYEREFYTGFLGELNLKLSKSRNTNRKNIENNAYASIKTYSNFYVNLRCMQLKSNKAIIYVGGGITKDSVAENEWEETVNKTKTMLSILS